MSAQTIFPYSTGSPWYPARDGDPSAMAIFQRHYTYEPGSKQYQFVGPGESIVLLTRLADALFVWRKFINDAGDDGVNCAVFRNESRMRSSFLIEHAVNHARRKWPDERFYTYVNPNLIRSTNPGYCFQMAGWRKCGVTKKRKLIILELPNE